MKENGIFLCEKAILDGRTNMLSLVNMYESTLQPLGYPMGFSNIAFVCLLENDSEDIGKVFKAQLSVHHNSIAISSIPVDINFQGSRNTRLILEFNGMIINNEGDLVFELKLTDTEFSIVKKLRLLPAVKIK